MSREIGVFVAWPYANGELHLGHVAGAYLPADIFARYHRLRGNRVLMVSGSDAHGTPITLKATEEKRTPMSVVEEYHRKFLESWQGLGISFDLFTHTHTKNHQSITQDFFRKMHEQGDLVVQTQQQFYDEEAKIFLPDRYVRGTCPFCGYDRARGDQCENCGKTFAATELKDPQSRITESVPVIRDTDHFFFRMPKYSEQLKAYIEQNTHWRPAVSKFTMAMIEEGLHTRPITRDITWGVPVPIEGWEEKVIYVWFDAVIGYFSASVEWSALHGEELAWERWWKNSDAKGFYFIGKDNIPFHSVIWPIELLAYDEEMNLPYDIPANQFLNIDGEKFSTSRGLAVWLLDVLKNFDADSVRYCLASILPETKDSNFTWEEFLARNNGELVAAWGNLVNRVFGFAYSRYDGKVPEPQELDERDRGMLKQVEDAFPLVAEHYEKVNLRDALKEAMGVVREVNRYLDEKAPWKVFKEDPAAAGTSVFVAMNVIDSLKTLLAPVLPFSSQQIHEFFGYQEPLFGEQKISTVGEEDDVHEVLTYVPTAAEQETADRWKPSNLSPGTAFSKPTPLYKVIDEKVIAEPEG